MRKYFERRWLILVILAVLVTLDPVASSMLNYRMRDIYNAASNGQNKILVIRLLTLGFLLWMAKRVLVTTIGGLKMYIIANIRRDIKRDIFFRTLGLRPSSIKELSGGDWVSLFTNDITLIESRYINSLLDMFSCIVSLIILSGSFFALDTFLAAVITSFGVLSVIIPISFSRILNKTHLEYSRRLGVFTQKIKEYINAFSTVKNFAVEAQFNDHFDQVNCDTESAKFNSDYALNVANHVGTLLAWFMQFIAIACGVVLMTQGKMAMGTVVAAQGFASDIATPLIGLINNINAIRSSQSIVKRLYKAANPDEEPTPSVPAEIPGKRNTQHGELRFSHVSLHSDNQTVIDDFSFTFEPHKKYLIVGRNGSGKSSLFRLLCQYYMLTEGNIQVDGLNAQCMTGKELSTHVSYMNENVAILTDSVRNNILLYREESNETINAALKEAHIQMDIGRNVSDNGGNISSGEKRRIEIARTLLSKADIMIFDEVISTLDTETAYEIEKMILSFQNKTVIQISHNFTRTLIERYDEILVMDGGRLLDHGTFQELLERCSYFQHICRLKFGQ